MNYDVLEAIADFKAAMEAAGYDTSKMMLTLPKQEFAHLSYTALIATVMHHQPAPVSYDQYKPAYIYGLKCVPEDEQ